MNWSQHFKLLHRLTGRVRFAVHTGSTSGPWRGVHTVTYWPGSESWSVDLSAGFVDDQNLDFFLKQHPNLRLLEEAVP